VGANTNTQTWVTFSFQDLEDIVRFDLSNAIFTTYDSVLKQNVGIPMGSPLSPVLANLICAYHEVHYLREQRLDNCPQPVDGTRYVDDGLWACGAIRGDETSEAIADNNLKIFMETCYKDLCVEVDENRIRIKMLESVICNPDHDPNHVGIIYWHKNKDAVMKDNKQTFLKFQHFTSFSPLNAKIGVMKSTFLRMAAAADWNFDGGIENSSSGMNIFDSVFMELKLLGYSLGSINSAFRSLRGSDVEHGGIWEGAKRRLDDVW
jgi:hypothetical protein